MAEPRESPDEQRTAPYAPVHGGSRVPSTVSSTVAASAAKSTGGELAVGAARPGAPRISGYALIEEIARGGMGRVYAATDLELDRRVAIKTLLPGADPQRFVNESRITASLPHPGIPPVHALGALEDGAPFLAMKLIQGRTLHELLEEREHVGADLPHFTQIFQQIAQAVGFAHAQGVIHRDLKPLNVMVGAFGEVQVMDWGLAKRLKGGEGEQEQADAATSASLQSTMTAHGAIMGTPGYLAPEQARGEEVDARADVFALGATLATILTGRPAFVSSTGLDSISRAARGDMSEVMQRLDAADADRELVRIAKHCLQADRQQRPSDALQVAEAISTYRDRVEERLRLAELSASEARIREAELRKRRRVWLCLAATFLGGAVISSALALWANAARQAEYYARLRAQGLQTRAERGEALAENRLKQVEQEKLRAEEQRRIAEAVRAFLQNKLLLLADTNKQADELLRMGASAALARPNPTIRELLDRAVGELSPENIELNFPNQPALQGELLFTAGNAYLAVGGRTQAIDLLQRSADLRSRAFGPHSPEAHASLNNLGNACREAGQFQRALSILEPLLEAKLAQYGDSNPGTLSTLQNLALTHADLGHLTQAIELHEQALALCQSSTETDIHDLMTAQQNLASVYQDAGRLDEAEQLMQRTLEQRRETLGPEHPAVFNTLNNLASIFQSRGDIERALRCFQEAESGQTAKLGAEHPDTLVTLNNVAIAYERSGRIDDARQLLEEIHAKQLRTVGSEHRTTLSTLNNLAHVYRVQGKLNDSIRLLREVTETRTRILGEEHYETLNSLNNLGLSLQNAGDIDEALRVFERVAEIRKRNFGEEHVDTLTTLNNLASIYRKKDRIGEALNLLEFVLASRERQLGADNPITLTTVLNLSTTRAAAGETEKAVRLLEAARTPLEVQLGPDHPTTLTALNNLAMFYHRSGDMRNAVKLFEAVAESRVRTLGEEHPSTLISLNNIGRMYEDLGDVPKCLEVFERMADAALRSEASDGSIPMLMGNAIRVHENAEQWSKAEKWRRMLLEILKEQLGTESPDYRRALAELALNLRRQDKWAEALPLQRESLALLETATPGNWEVAAMRMLVGGALVETEQYHEAEKVLQQAHQELADYAVLHPKEVAENPFLSQARREAAQRLYEVYQATDRPAEAQKYEQARQPPKE